MLPSIISLQIILMLFPGFLTLAVRNGLVATREKTGVDKVVEAIAFSLVDYGVYLLISCSLGLSLIEFQIQKEAVQLTGLNIESIILILAIATLIGVLFATLLERGWLYTILRKLKITYLTGRITVWNDVFSAHRGIWVLVHLKDGRKIVGWPKYYSEVSTRRELFLAEAAWMTDDAKFVEVEGEGILITEECGIDLIEVLR